MSGYAGFVIGVLVAECVRFVGERERERERETMVGWGGVGWGGWFFSFMFVGYSSVLKRYYTGVTI